MQGKGLITTIAVALGLICLNELLPTWYANKIETEAEYWRNIFFTYINNLRYKREEILFEKNFKNIEKALKDGNKIKIKYHNYIRLINPYFIKVSDSESRSYLFCYCDKNKDYRNYRVSEIEEIWFTNEKIEIKDKDLIKDKKIIDFTKINGKIKNFENKSFLENKKKILEKNEEIFGNDNEENGAKESKYIDLYEKYMRKVSKETTIKSAFHLPIKILEKGQYHITTGEISTDDLKMESKKHKTTIGKYLLAVYFKVLLDRYSSAKNLIVIGVPVDLRRIFEEKTYRNFFMNITPSVDASLGAYSLSEIITYLDNYFALKITKKEFYKSIYKAMNPMRNIIIKSVPYLIKRIFFPFIFDYYGERGYTTGFSNLGIFKIDKKYEKYLKGFRFLPPPSKRCKIKMGVISDSQKVYINFGNLTADYDIERDFFVYLRKRGIRSKIITNY